MLGRLQLPIIISQIDADIPNIKYEFNSMFFFTFILLCTLAAAVLVSTLSATVRKNELMGLCTSEFNENI